MDNLNKELLNTFGRIIYAVAKTDGEVQDSEVAVIQNVIDNNEWAQEVELSFEVERELDEDADVIFDKAISLFKFNEIRDHYVEFVDLLEQIAEAHDGIVNEEERLIDKFKEKLKENGIF